jgi:hypothetical protein
MCQVQNAQGFKYYVDISPNFGNFSHVVLNISHTTKNKMHFLYVNAAGAKDFHKKSRVQLTKRCKW